MKRKLWIFCGPEGRLFRESRVWRDERGVVGIKFGPVIYSLLKTIG
jgi:Flp pilus assembly protein TadG